MNNNTMIVVQLNTQVSRSIKKQKLRQAKGQTGDTGKRMVLNIE